MEHVMETVMVLAKTHARVRAVLDVRVPVMMDVTHTANIQVNNLNVYG